MNLLILEAHELDADGRVHLTDRRADHLNQVLRVDAGAEVRAGVLGGGVGTATVERVEPTGRRTAAITVQVKIPPTTAERPELDLIVALPRPAVLHRVLQHAATLGVGEIHLINAWRVEKSYFQSPSLEPEAVRKHLWLGLEQGRRTWLPEVHIHRRLVPFVEGLGPPPPDVRRLLAHPAAVPIEDAVPGGADAPWPERLQLAIGPEGGWRDRELETFAGAGFAAVALGDWILRSEAAVTAAVAQIALLRRLRSPERPAPQDRARTTGAKPL
ncbi:MAG: RsmE family RNA methyltransferase [Acidobacteriota bacterium]